jgi:hypothetical protein
MNALDHYPLETVKQRARTVAGIRPHAEPDLHQPSHREPPV